MSRILEMVAEIRYKNTSARNEEIAKQQAIAAKKVKDTEEKFKKHFYQEIPLLRKDKINWRVGIQDDHHTTYIEFRYNGKTLRMDFTGSWWRYAYTPYSIHYSMDGYGIPFRKYPKQDFFIYLADNLLSKCAA